LEIKMLNVSIPPCTIMYNRPAKIYIAANGQEVARGTKRQCELAALAHDCPDVHDEIMAIIANAEASRIYMVDAEAVTERAIKAGFILRDGLLLPPRPRPFEKQLPGEVAFCLSQSDKENGYAISVSFSREGFFICDCHDWYNAPRLASGQVACKHILAQMIALALFVEETDNVNF